MVFLLDFVGYISFVPLYSLQIINFFIQHVTIGCEYLRTEEV